MLNITNSFALKANETQQILTNARVRSNHVRFQPTLEFCESLTEKVGDIYCAVEPLTVNNPDLRFVALDHAKKCLTKKFGASWGFISLSSILKQFWKQDVGNLGIVTGQYNNRFLLVVDIDKKQGLRSCDVDTVVNAINTQTFMVNTPSGGKHLYFWSNEKIGCPKAYSNHGIDIKCEGGYVVAAGSRTKAGYYAWDVENTLFSQKVATLPENIWDVLNTFLDNIPVEVPVAKEVKKSEEKNSIGAYQLVPEGVRSNWLTQQAGSLVHKVKDEQELFNKLIELKNNNFENPETFCDKEVGNIAKWLWNKEQGKEKSSIGAYQQTNHLQGVVSNKLQVAINELPKTEKHSVSLAEVSVIIQQYFEKQGFKYNKPINQNVVAAFLKVAGFTSKTVKQAQVLYRFWNIDIKMLEKIIG